MRFGDWPHETIEEIQRGLLLIGWRADMRLTDDDALLIQKVALESIQLHKENRLTPDQIDRLAIAAHNIMEFQVMNVDERASMASGPYSESNYFSDLIPLIDEATLCYLRGYDTAALANLFIVLESYLLRLYGWTNTTRKPRFTALKASVRKHPAGNLRTEAEEILSKVYHDYQANSPPQFFFNRHGLLHGLRGPKGVDRMNCVRMYLLFDILCFAEGLPRSVIVDERFTQRHDIYSKCTRLGSERALLQKN
jgi:hypothetical protein